MAPLKDKALPLLDSLWPMSERRNIIVHGYYQGFTGGSTYLFTTYRREGDQGTFLFHHYSHEEVVSLAADIESARSSLEVLSKNTFSTPFPPLGK
jgi:hypothetical protein